MQFGMLNEFKIIDAVNEKKFNELSDHWKNIVKNILFKELIIKDTDMIIAYKCEAHIKPDMAIIVQNVTKFISIKCGHRNTFHQETINTFMEFLRSNFISEETINTLLLFLYGDGTIDGTGNRRYYTRELIDILGTKLKKANNELNSNKDFIKKSIMRFVFQGIDNKNEIAQFLYYGTYKDGIMVSKRDLMKFMLWKEMDWMYLPHIGTLVISPYLRDVQNISKNQYKRDYVNLSWRNISKHICMIQEFKKKDEELINKCYKHNEKLKIKYGRK
ncbi:MAG: hypothetical protein ACI311_03150 [Bacilli bacterium]